MNGRVYDPEIGRFLSADPHVQAPQASQSYNRYAYALNNPLKYTDPSGFFFKKLFKGIKKFFKKYGRMILAIGLAALTGYVALLGYTGTSWGALAFGELVAAAGVGGAAVAGAASGFVGGLVSTGSLKAALKGAAFGAISGAVAFGIGQLEIAALAKDFAHGVAQGLISEASGGDFKSGFLGAALGHFAGRKAELLFKGNGAEAVIGRTVVAAVAGGSASALGGGKFANGAVSAAFSHLFNNEAHRIKLSEDRYFTEQDARATVKAYARAKGNAGLAKAVDRIQVFSDEQMAVAFGLAQSMSNGNEVAELLFKVYVNAPRGGAVAVLTTAVSEWPTGELIENLDENWADLGPIGVAAGDAFAIRAERPLQVFTRGSSQLRDVMQAIREARGQ